MKHKLYIYLNGKDIQKTGILTPIQNVESALQHYSERAKSTKKQDIIKFLDLSFPNRSKSISVLTQKIPLNIKRYDLQKFIRTTDLYQISSIEQLIKNNLIESIWQAIPGKQKFKKVSEINFESINWPTDTDKWGFTGIKHYQLVLKSGILQPKYFKKISMYESPYTLDEIKQKYSEKIYQKLKSDPVHKWRAETGIQLIHEEPTLDQQLRTWFNWTLMTKQQKQISNKKSKQLFGLTNFQHFNTIIKKYDPQQKQIKSLVDAYNERDMENNNLHYIHLSNCPACLRMKPRVPKNIMRIEDGKIPRICFSTSILQASGAINTSDLMYIHIPKQEPKYIISTDNIKNKVQDSPNTGQVWILDKNVQTRIIGKVHFKAYWKDNRFNFPLIYKDNRGCDIYTYFKDYDLQLFPKLYHNNIDTDVHSTNFEVDQITEKQYDNITKLYRCQPTKTNNISNKNHKFIFLSPYKCIAGCFLNRLSILNALPKCQSLNLSYSPFKAIDKSKLNHIWKKIIVYTNYQLEKPISGSSTGYLEQIDIKNINKDHLYKIHNSNNLEYVYTRNLKVTKNIKYSIEWQIQYSKSMKQKYGKAKLVENYCYYPVTKQDIQNLYISVKKLNYIAFSIQDLQKQIKNKNQKNKYVAFIKIPILFNKEKTDDFYCQAIYQNNSIQLIQKQNYSFIFEKSDIRYFEEQESFEKIYNEIMKDLFNK